MKRAVLAAVGAVALFASDNVWAAWQPGLVEGKLTGYSKMNTNVYPSTTNIVTGPIKGTETGWGGNTIYVYRGQIHLEAGTTWFAESIDDATWLKINGSVLINDSTWGNLSKGSIKVDTAGWYDFEVRFQNGNGGCGVANGTKDRNGKLCGFGLFEGETAPTSMTGCVFPENASATDMSRFRYDDGLGFGDTLRVTGNPSKITPTGVVPAYGVVSGLDVGATLSCSAPAVWTNDLADTAATCLGYKVYVNGCVTDEGFVNAFTYSHPQCDNGVLLTWQWGVEHKATFIAQTGGTVSKAFEWVADGNAFTVTAIPTAGQVFVGWRDGTGAVVSHEETLSVRIVGPQTYTAVFGGAYYVATDGNDANTGTSPTEPLLTIQAALDKNAAVVHLADGVYDVTNTLTITNAVIVRGTSPGAQAVVRASAVMNGDDPSIFVLKHKDAVLKNIAVTTKAFGSEGYGRGVLLDGDGTVDGCVITNCFSGYKMNGGGVWLSGGGTVRNTVFADDAAHASGGHVTYGGAVYMTGGLVERCSIRRCGRTHNASSVSGGIHLTGGTVRNCLVAECSQGHASGWTADSGGSGVGITGGTLENCTIVGNFQNSSTAVTGIRVRGAGTIRNCIIWGNVNAKGTADWSESVTTYTAVNNCTGYALSDPSNTTDDPSFVDAANGDYHTGLGAGVDAGRVQEWMATATDLDGRKRILGDAPDMGCYEYVPAALACGFDVAAGTGLGIVDVTFTARVKGTDLTDIVYTWTLTDSLGVETVTNGTDLASFVMSVPTGIYAVSLTVKNGSGDTASATKPNVFTVSPKDIYVAENGSATYPYASYENGTPSLQTALDAAADGSVIHVDDGWYTLDDTLKVLKGVEIVAKTGPADTFVHGTAQSSGMPLISIDSAKAVLSGITLSGISRTGTRPEKWGGLAIGTSGGLVTNCWIVGHKTVNNSANGSGARLSAGTLVDCIISNNYTQCSGGSGWKGGGLYVNGAALVERCWIVNNKVTNGGKSYGGGVYMNAGMVRNCFIADNEAANYGGGATVDGGQLVNCTLVNNKTGTDNGGISGSGTVIDCLVYNSTANGVKQDMTDPGFVNAGAGDYHLNSASAAVDAGTATDPGELDLEHHDRVSGDAADKGCFEYDQSQFSVGIAYKTLGGAFAPMDVEFSAKATPATVQLDETQTWWTFDGTEPSAENHGAVGTVVTNNLVPGRYTVRFKTVYKDETFLIDQPDWLLLYGETVYLVSENPNAKVPYATRETAATSLATALSFAIDGATLLIDEGKFPSSGTHEIRRKLTVRSVNGPAKTTINANGNGKPFAVYHAEAVVTGLTILDSDNWDNGGAMYQEAGLVSNCVFNAGRTWNNGGGGARIVGGTMVDCVFTNCFSKYSDQTGAALVIVGSGALVDRCVIVGSYQNSVKANGAVYVSAGKLRNSLVAYNTPSKNSGIVVGANGIVENCTVVSNGSATAGAYVGLSTVAGAQVRNTIAWGNVDSTGAVANAAGEGTFDHCSTDGTDPRFRNIARRDWRLWRSSPCVNAGAKLDWMTEDATDLRGNPRIHSFWPDLGCYENTSGGLMLIVR